MALDGKARIKKFSFKGDEAVVHLNHTVPIRLDAGPFEGVPLNMATDCVSSTRTRPVRLRGIFIETSSIIEFCIWESYVLVWGTRDDDSHLEEMTAVAVSDIWERGLYRFNV